MQAIVSRDKETRCSPRVAVLCWGSLLGRGTSGSGGLDRLSIKNLRLRGGGAAEGESLRLLRLLTPAVGGWPETGGGACAKFAGGGWPRYGALRPMSAPYGCELPKPYPGAAGWGAEARLVVPERSWGGSWTCPAAGACVPWPGSARGSEAMVSSSSSAKSQGGIGMTN